MLTDLGRLRDPAANVVLGAAVVDDILGLIILAVVTGIALTGSVSAGAVVLLTGKAVVFLAVALGLGLRLAPVLVRWIGRLRARGTLVIYSVVLAMALVVAGIGIMNIMLVSVTERTKEIGIRKAIGARPENIMLQFLLEAVILCNAGGVVGILVGFGLGNVVTMFASFDAAVPLEWALIGLGFCSAVGIGFGFLPAVKAARLHPIDALRYE